MGIRIGTTTTATASVDVYLDYRCSKCGTQNKITQKIMAAASSTTTALGVTSNENFVSEAHYLAYEKVRRLCSFKLANRYTTAEFSCRCHECGHREPWAKMRYSYLSFVRVLCAIAALVLLPAGVPVYSTVACVLVFAGSYLYKILHLKQQQKQLEELPAYAIPRITMQDGGNVVELAPPSEIPADSWICYNCGEIQPKENTYCDYCKSSKAWSESKNNKADR